MRNNTDIIVEHILQGRQAWELLPALAATVVVTAEFSEADQEFLRKCRDPNIPLQSLRLNTVIIFPPPGEEKQAVLNEQSRNLLTPVIRNMLCDFLSVYPNRKYMSLFSPYLSETEYYELQILRNHWIATVLQIKLQQLEKNIQSNHWQAIKPSDIQLICLLKDETRMRGIIAAFLAHFPQEALNSLLNNFIFLPDELKPLVLNIILEQDLLPDMWRTVATLICFSKINPIYPINNKKPIDVHALIALLPFTETDELAKLIEKNAKVDDPEIALSLMHVLELICNFFYWYKQKHFFPSDWCQQSLKKILSRNISPLQRLQALWWQGWFEREDIPDKTLSALRMELSLVEIYPYSAHTFERIYLKDHMFHGYLHQESVYLQTEFPPNFNRYKALLASDDNHVRFHPILLSGPAADDKSDVWQQCMLLTLTTWGEPRSRLPLNEVVAAHIARFVRPPFLSRGSKMRRIVSFADLYKRDGRGLDDILLVSAVTQGQYCLAKFLENPTKGVLHTFHPGRAMAVNSVDYYALKEKVALNDSISQTLTADTVLAAKLKRLAILLQIMRELPAAKISLHLTLNYDDHYHPLLAFLEQFPAERFELTLTVNAYVAEQLQQFSHLPFLTLKVTGKIDSYCLQALARCGIRRVVFDRCEFSVDGRSIRAFFDNNFGMQFNFVGAPPREDFVKYHNHQIAWLIAVTVLAFLRANRAHPFRDSIMRPELLAPLLAMVANALGVEGTIIPVDLATKLARFVDTRYARMVVAKQPVVAQTTAAQANNAPAAQAAYVGNSHERKEDNSLKMKYALQVRR